jgi:hypothetical protein
MGKRCFRWLLSISVRSALQARNAATKALYYHDPEQRASSEDAIFSRLHDSLARFSKRYPQRFTSFQLVQRRLPRQEYVSGRIFVDLGLNESLSGTERGKVT